MLFHSGTGEVAELPRRGPLHFDHEGFGFVDFEDGSDPEWADKVLKSFLFKDVNKCLFIKRPDGQRENYDDLFVGETFAKTIGFEARG